MGTIARFADAAKAAGVALALLAEGYAVTWVPDDPHMVSTNCGRATFDALVTKTGRYLSWVGLPVIDEESRHKE